MHWGFLPLTPRIRMVNLEIRCVRAVAHRRLCRTPGDTAFPTASCAPARLFSRTTVLQSCLCMPEATWEPCAESLQPVSQIFPVSPGSLGSPGSPTRPLGRRWLACKLPVLDTARSVEISPCPSGPKLPLAPGRAIGGPWRVERASSMTSCQVPPDRQPTAETALHPWRSGWPAEHQTNTA